MLFGPIKLSLFVVWSWWLLVLALRCQQGRCFGPSLRARRPQAVAAVPRGAGRVLGLGLLWSAKRHWVVWSSLSGPTPRQYFPCCPYSKAGLATGFLLLVSQVANLSCSLTAVSKLNVSNLLSCSLASERLFLSHKLSVKPLARLQVIICKSLLE